MRRFIALSVVLVVLAAACGDDAVTTQPTAPATTSTTEAVAAPEATTTSEAPTTTSEAITTTTTLAPTTTTTTMPPVLDHPLLPAALHRTLIPWDEVDGRWALALFSTEAGYTDVEPPDDEIVVAYLVGPDGTSYEITHWPAASAPLEIVDVRPDGRRALLGFPPGEGIPAEVGTFEMLDVSTGSTTFWDSGAHVLFTRPTGRDYVVRTWPDTLELYTEGGSHLRTLGGCGAESIDYGIPLRPWLYGPTGLSLIVNNPPYTESPYGPSLIDNRGNHLRFLDAPGAECSALRWWSDTTVVERCREPHSPGYDVFTLWIIDTTGTEAPEALTTTDHAMPAEAFDGYVDAIRAGGTVMVQGFYSVGSGWSPIARLDPGADPVPLGDEAAGQLVAAGPSTVTVYRLGCCGEVWGGLLIFDHAGGEIARIAAPDGFFGVFDAHGVGGV